MKISPYQTPELRNEEDVVIRVGTYGKYTPFATSDNTGILDYINNNLEALKNALSGAYVYVANKASLPTSGDATKIYVTQDDGKSYKWTGTEWSLFTSQVNGLSAYEIAKAHGFSGTEEEWIKSIEGDTISSATVDDDGYLTLNMSSGSTIKTALKPITDCIQYRDEARTSATTATTQADKAKASADSITDSANVATEQANNAKIYASNAKTSETKANNSETKAKASEEASASSASEASTSANNAKASANSASASATSASTSAFNASEAEQHASTSETNAKNALVEAQKIQKEVESALSKVTGFAKYAGSVDNYSDLPTTGVNKGDVWNIVNADTTHQIKAGDNVIWNGTAWDNLAGFVDLSNYPTNSDVAKAIVSTTYFGGTITFIHKDGTQSTATIGDTSHATKADQDGEGNVIVDTYYKKSDASTIHQSFQNQISTKQDKLTFDSTPTANSNNPVTSAGIKAAIDAKTVDLSNYYTKAQVDSAVSTAKTEIEEKIPAITVSGNTISFGSVTIGVD